MTELYKSIVLIPELGEAGVLPDGGILNAGGVEGPHFTVGGQAVILKDGTASDGSGPVIIVDTTTIGNVVGVEHIQPDAEGLWTITHSRNSRKIQVTVWDENDEILFPNSVKIVNTNVVEINFNTPQIGRAILMIF